MSLGFTDDRKGHDNLAKDNKPFTTLGYANGPGGYAEVVPNVRPDLRNTSTGTEIYINYIVLEMKTLT